MSDSEIIRSVRAAAEAKSAMLKREAKNARGRRRDFLLGRSEGIDDVLGMIEQAIFFRRRITNDRSDERAPGING